MAVTIKPPGVEVVQEIRRTSPTIATPTLWACLIGPCKQIQDVLDSDNAIDANALSGTYSGDAKNFSFPGLEDAAVVLTNKVRVFLRFGNGTTLTELEDDEFTILTDGNGVPTYVRVLANSGGVTSGSGVRVKVYIQFEALRTDVTANPAVSGVVGAPRGIIIETLEDIDTYLGDVSIRNPLALGAYIAKLNAPNTSVVCMGVDELGNTTYGTQDAYARALEAMEGVDVYTMVPLTQDAAILPIFQVHVDSMSLPENKLERICILNHSLPTNYPDETIASGPYGNSVVGQNYQFNTSVDLSAEGVENGDILEISGEDDTWTVTGITGTYTVTVSPAGAIIPAGLIDVDWTITREGELVTTKSEVAEAMAEIGVGYADRRVVVWFPDIVEIDIDGLTYELPGFYGACATAGQIGELGAQMPLTNVPMAGLTSLDNSDDYFSPTQLNTIAAGGIFIVVQPTGETSPRCRHQLTTEIDTIETRELSITKAVDYISKVIRNSLNPLIGNRIITTRFINLEVAPRVTGILRYLQEADFLTKWNISRMAQSETYPDTIEITIDLTLVYPCNRIEVTLVV